MRKRDKLILIVMALTALLLLGVLGYQYLGQKEEPAPLFDYTQQLAAEDVLSQEDVTRLMTEHSEAAELLREFLGVSEIRISNDTFRSIQHYMVLSGSRNADVKALYKDLIDTAFTGAVERFNEDHSGRWEIRNARNQNLVEFGPLAMKRGKMVGKGVRAEDRLTVQVKPGSTVSGFTLNHGATAQVDGVLEGPGEQVPLGGSKQNATHAIGFAGLYGAVDYVKYDLYDGQSGKLINRVEEFCVAGAYDEYVTALLYRGDHVLLGYPRYDTYYEYENYAEFWKGVGENTRLSLKNAVIPDRKIIEDPSEWQVENVTVFDPAKGKNVILREYDEKAILKALSETPMFRMQERSEPLKVGEYQIVITLNGRLIALNEDGGISTREPGASMYYLMDGDQLYRQLMQILELQ